MTPARKLVAASAIAAVACASWLVGAHVQRAEVADDADALRVRVAELESRAASGPRAAPPVSERALRAEIDALRARVAELESRPAASAPAAAGAVAPDAASRRSRAGELRAEIERRIAAGEGPGAIEPLRELAALVPEGRDAAMELLLAVRDDLERLSISDVAWEALSCDPAVQDLCAWAVGHPAPVSFRELAVYSLVYRHPDERTVDAFAAALAAETDTDVQRALVERMASIDSPRSRAGLRDVFADPARDRRARLFAATELEKLDDGEVQSLLRRALDHDADPVVRAGVRAALSARQPPATGYLVTGFVGASTTHRAGIEIGDVIVSYDGKSTAQDLGRPVRAALERDGRIAIEVVRSGARVALEADPGWLGLIGRHVVKRTGD